MTCWLFPWRLLPLLVLLGACGDPFDRPGTWHAAGINQANLDAAVVRKSDLAVGQHLPGSDAVLDAAAVVRLHADQTKKLTIETTSSMNGGNGS